ncbi:MAG: hypothetical protein J5967_05685 [Oscillospiraceae bacterium]|nr:hypothetical protein [Oscillospiraceae bacterium]
MNSKTLDYNPEISRAETFQDFQMNGMLTAFKLKKYLPTMILTNLSNLLLVSVDGLVVGNLLGANALASVNIFYPATIFIGVLSVLASCGISTCLSLYIGKNDLSKLPAIKASAKLVMLRFRPDAATLMMIDNGRCIALDQDTQMQELMISNYDLIRKVAKEVKYQYIQDMNYTVIEI